MAGWDTVSQQGYIQYNSAGSSHRSKFDIRRSIKRGDVIRPSMIFIHYSIFKKAEEALYNGL
jgi:hypothetical protein